MKNKRPGFLLVEALLALSISLAILLSLTYFVQQHYQLLREWEWRTNAHKLMLQSLQAELPEEVTLRGDSYHLQTKSDQIEVSVRGHQFTVNW